MAEETVRPTDVDEKIVLALKAARTLSAWTPSRELSLAITRLEEARHWLRELDAEPTR